MWHREEKTDSILHIRLIWKNLQNTVKVKAMCQVVLMAICQFATKGIGSWVGKVFLKTCEMKRFMHENGVSEEIMK